MSETDPFAEIRPYNDEEVPRVVARLLKSADFATALARLKLAWLHDRAPDLARRLVNLWLHWRLRNVGTVEDFQLLIAPQLTRLMARTCTFSSDGLDRLDTGSSWLFISNHRDITMDPALTNHTIHYAGHRTLAIAIGDNLLRQAWVADLMRLNKSFVVKRGITAPRELMAASKQLANFIRYTIAENRGPVWIAQREGRAKDGRDATEPAVIKMLSLSRDKKVETLAETLSALKIVPVAISYELDPCDALKAAELAAGPDFKKSEDDDVLSIGRGIAGQKGCVHLSFGQPMASDDLDVAGVVDGIDNHILNGYRLFENSLWAWQRLNNTQEVPAVTIHPGSISREAFFARIDEMPESHRPYALAMYANPLVAALEAQQEPDLSDGAPDADTAAPVT